MWSSKPPEILVGFLNVQAADQLDEAGTLEICKICPNAFDLSQLTLTIMVVFLTQYDTIMHQLMVSTCSDWFLLFIVNILEDESQLTPAIFMDDTMEMAWKWLSNTKLAIKTIAYHSHHSHCQLRCPDHGSRGALLRSWCCSPLDRDCSDGHVMMSWTCAPMMSNDLSWFCHHCICRPVFRTCGSAGLVPSRTSAPLPLCRPCHVPRIWQYSISRAWSTWEAAKQRGQMDQKVAIWAMRMTEALMQTSCIGNPPAFCCCQTLRNPFVGSASFRGPKFGTTSRKLWEN